ncbi:MAG: hypothetical protein AB1Z98_20870 [Nannocystaceae bacterium]
MTRTAGRRDRWWGVVAVVAGWLVPTPALAVIPYETLITPGQLRGIAHAPGDPWLYGYWEYLPESFEEYGPASLPLLVFLPGIGEYDDVSSCPGGTDLCTAEDCGNDGLCRNLTWGPQQLMRLGQWDDVSRPFIMVSPQHPVPPFSTGQWNVDQLDDYLQFIVDNYPVDQRRMYLIGMSQGGRGVLQYTQAHPRRFTAVAPAPGGNVLNDASCYFQDTALWVFHGEDDTDGNLGPGVFSPCNMVNVAYQYENPGLYGSAQCQAIVGQPRPPGRLTMFYDVGHFAWVPTVDPIGSGFGANEWASDQGCGIPATFREYEAALDPDGVYSWFLSLDRPRVVAPDDLLVADPETSLTAVVTDDDAFTIEWTQTAGPAAVLGNADTETLDVSALLPGEQYTFQVYVLDADDQWDLDEVVVTTEAFGGGGSSSGGSSSSGGGSSGDTGSSSGRHGDSSDGGGATDGGGETRGEVGDTTDGGAPTGTSAAGSSTGDGPPGPTSGSPEDGTGGGATGAGSATEATDGRADDPAVDDGGGGCGCRTEAPPAAAWWAWAPLLLGLRRRRR